MKKHNSYNRIELVQEIFRKTNFKTYLEIGTEDGLSFLPIKCKYKIAVDSHFLISRKRKIKWFFKNPYNIRNKYFEETSDDFFRKRENLLNRKKKVDVVLIDGLHTFQASLKDVLNSLKHINSKGIIIMHDCLPPHKAAALQTNQFPNEEQKKIDGWTGEWCGDVWKSIIYLRRNLYKLLDVSVINTDYGLGVIRIKNKIDRNLKIDEESFNRINKITYEELLENVESMLGLKSPEYARKIVKEISAHNTK